MTDKKLVIISDNFEIKVLDSFYYDAVNFYNKSRKEIDKIIEDQGLNETILEVYEEHLHSSDVCFHVWEDDFMEQVEPIIELLRGKL
jgi:multimeric flavodoxin WrbA